MKYNFMPSSNTNYPIDIKENIISLLEWGGGSDYMNACYDEVEILGDLFKDKKNILDLGCGIGRSSVYLRNSLNMDNSKFYLCDYFGEKETWKFNQTNYKDGFGYHKENEIWELTDKDITKKFCDYNNMINYKIIDMRNTEEIKKLENIDLIFSFQCIGYHFPIKENIKKLYLKNIISSDAVFIFGVRIGKKALKIKDYPVDFKIEDLGLDLVERRKGNWREDYLIYRSK